MAVTERGPELEGVVLTEHEPLTRVHEPPGENNTVPEGVIDPDPDESATTAVQFVGWFTTTLLGLQLTEVEESRKFTVNAKGWDVVLPLCVESPL